MSLAHTEGPWRWEINRKHKSLHLVGGRPKFDLTVMDFDRWGMGGATIRLRDLAHDGMNMMHKVHERPDWIADFSGRGHHADWCAAVVHPDARLMAAAPTLLAALRLAHSRLVEKCTQNLMAFGGADVDALTTIEAAIAAAERTTP